MSIAWPDGTAFPSPRNPDGTLPSTSGLTKREYFAAIALQGLLSADGFRLLDERVRDAVKAADLLILALNTEVAE